MFELMKQVRPNIWKLEPYSCARDEFKGEASVYLDANENPFNAPYCRYPDPMQWKLKTALSKRKGINKKNIFLGNGSDEAIDLVYRIFCEPKEDNVVAIAPTYGMYKVCADVNNVEYRSVPLDENFHFSAKKLLEKTDENTRVIWLCSPNNPTGNLLDNTEIETLLKSFNGIVVVDEAYIDFANVKSWSEHLSEFPNLIVLQTLSKAWACAGIRLGIAYASEAIIGLFNKVKYPYNVNFLTQEKSIEILKDIDGFNAHLHIILQERDRVQRVLSELPMVKKMYHTDSNFVLVKVNDANKTYQYLVNRGIIVRNRNTVLLCGNCLRITFGSPEENDTLLEALSTME